MDHGGFINYRAAAEVDEDGGFPHGGEFACADQAARFMVQRSGNDDVVTAGNHFDEPIWAVDLVHERIQLATWGKMALDGKDPHTHWADAGRNGAADVAVSDDAHSPAGNHFDIEGLPHSGELTTNHAAKILGKIQDCGERKFAEGRAENAFAVR